MKTWQNCVLASKKGIDHQAELDQKFIFHSSE